MASASKKRKKSKKNTMESAAFRDEIILWVVLAFSIILCLSNFGIGGSVGNKLSSVFFRAVWSGIFISFRSVWYC